MKIKHYVNAFLVFRSSFLFLVVGFIIASFLIYFTPLKHLSVIEPKIQDVSPESFYADFSVHPEKYVFIDVRPPEEYNKGHAEGSINVHLKQLYFERKILPKHNKTIVLICSGAASSGVAYSYLEHYGFLNLLRIHDGIKAWRAAGLPIAVSDVPQPDSEKLE